ncbi:MAG: DUF6056 family protein, partial [Pyrinomonadaceae bacterium]
AVVTFVAGGFSDAYVVLQTSALVLAIIAVERYAPADVKPALRAALVAGLIGSLLALAVVALAPGNGVRSAYFPPPPGLSQILKLSTLSSFRFISQTVLNHRIIFALLLLVPFLTVLRDFVPRDEQDDDGRRRAALLVLIPAGVFALVMSCVAPAFYGMSVMLPERAQVLPGFALVCGVLAWGGVAGEYCAAAAAPFVSGNARRIVLSVSSLLLVLMISSPVATCISTFALRGRARAYAADWDKQDAALRAVKDSGASELVVDQIGDFQTRLGLGRGDLHLSTDPKFWINQAVAKCYGLSSVAAREEVVNPPF